MKTISKIAIVIGIISLAVGIISRIAMAPVGLVPGGLEAEALLAFTNTCFLVAITFILLEILKGKQ